MLKWCVIVAVLRVHCLRHLKRKMGMGGCMSREGAQEVLANRNHTTPPDLPKARARHTT
jgi:hypothetical protein